MSAVSPLSPPLHKPSRTTRRVRQTGLRIALYSPGMVGLGHMRRNLLIAHALGASSLKPALLLLAEAREAGAFLMPPQVDCLTLPALRKNAAGQCTPRHLPLSLSAVIALRAETIRAALRSFAPDLLIVDHLPRGAFGELQPALSALRDRGRTRCVLGLRDVLEEPATVKQDWKRWQSAEAIRSYFDAVWVYGDPAVYDLSTECGFPASVSAKVTYTGYLDTRCRLDCEPTPVAELLQTLGLGARPLVLCLVGGGQDGAPLAEAFLRAPLPKETIGLVVAGPYMPAEDRQRLHALSAGRDNVRVVDFLSEPAPLLERADRVIAMGGYNSVCDVLAFRKHALIVPRGLPRREQTIRADRLAARGAFTVLHPEALSPAALGEWLATPARHGNATPRIDLGGLARLPALVRQVLEPDHDEAGAPADRLLQLA